MPEPMLEADAFYDAGDQGCAGPALGEINRILASLSAGQALEIRSTDRAQRGNLHAFCRMRGFRIEQEDVGPDRDRILVRR